MQQQEGRLEQVRLDSEKAVKDLASRLSKVESGASAKTVPTQQSSSTTAESARGTAESARSSSQSAKSVATAEEEGGEVPTEEESYESDFESPSATAHTASMLPPTELEETPSGEGGVAKATSGMDGDESVLSVPEVVTTPIPSEREGNADDEEESNEEVEEDLQEVINVKFLLHGIVGEFHVHVYRCIDCIFSKLVLGCSPRFYCTWHDYI